MQTLLAELKPDVQLRGYKKGFVVRRGPDEWYFEFRDHATKQGAARLPGRSDGRASAMGLPTANAATVELWGFRGVRTIHGRTRDKWTPAEIAEVDAMKSHEPLLWAGHVGISMDGGKSIYGFTPEQPPGMRVEKVIKDLINHEAYPGIVQDDTDVFALAEKMATERGWNTKPISAVELVDKPKKAEVVANVKRMAKAQPHEHGLGYSFPLDHPVDGEHFRDSNGFCGGSVRNCATFPERWGFLRPSRAGTCAGTCPSSRNGPPGTHRWTSAASQKAKANNDEYRRDHQ
jgi:hypothetical protein